MPETIKYAMVIAAFLLPTLGPFLISNSKARKAKRKRQMEMNKLRKERDKFRDFLAELKKRFPYDEDCDKLFIPYYSNHRFPAEMMFYKMKLSEISLKPSYYLRICCLKSGCTKEMPAEREAHHSRSCYGLNTCRTNCFANKDDALNLESKCRAFMDSCWEHYSKTGNIIGFDSVTSEKNFEWKSVWHFDPEFGRMTWEFEEGKFRELRYDEPFFDSIGLEDIELEQMQSIMEGKALKRLRLKSKRTGKPFTANLCIESWESRNGRRFRPKFKLDFANDANIDTNMKEQAVARKQEFANNGRS